MAELTISKEAYQIEKDDKITQVIAYTQFALFWGDLVTKEQIRVNTWLKTVSAPDRVKLLNSRMIQIIPNGKIAPFHFPEIFIPTSDILLFHLVPPSSDPVDYDPTEPNRKMEPVVALVHSIRINASIRIAQISSLSKFLDVVREPFTSIYDAEITCPMMPALGCMKVPQAILRQKSAIFASPN